MPNPKLSLVADALGPVTHVSAQGAFAWLLPVSTLLSDEGEGERQALTEAGVVWTMISHMDLDWRRSYSKLQIPALSEQELEAGNVLVLVYPSLVLSRFATAEDAGRYWSERALEDRTLNPTPAVARPKTMLELEDDLLRAQALLQSVHSAEMGMLTHDQGVIPLQALSELEERRDRAAADLVRAMGHTVEADDER